MTILHIEHPIIDFDLWRSAFDQFADARRLAGARSQRVSRPVDDDRYVIVDLEFDGLEQAERFREFLRSQVWTSTESSPALAGEPRTVVYETVDAHTTVSAGATLR